MALTINLSLTADATGTVDAITATYAVAPTLVDNKVLFLQTTGTNTGAVTFSPNGLTVRAVVVEGVALTAGQMPKFAILAYDLANTRWELLNPIRSSGGGGTWGSITGTLSNQTDLQTALNAKTGVIVHNTSTSSGHTGTTANTLIYSVLIPANTNTVGDFVTMFSQHLKKGSISTLSVRYYFNTVASLSSGAPRQVAMVNIGATSDTLDFGRIASIKSTTDTYTHNNAVSLVNRDSSGTSAQTNSSIDWTVDQYFIIAHQLSTTSDTTYVISVLINKN